MEAQYLISPSSPSSPLLGPFPSNDLRARLRNLIPNLLHRCNDLVLLVAQRLAQEIGVEIEDAASSGGRSVLLTTRLLLGGGVRWTAAAAAGEQ